MKHLIGDASIIVVCGPGGVGKTSLSAAIGLYAATQLRRKTLVLTVDPARRLATALGLADLTNAPQRVAIQGDDAPLYAAMLDAGQAWDNLIRTCAPDAQLAQEILDHPLYPNISQRFVQSREYVAADVLYSLVQANNFDLIVVDTPPSRNALDFVNAPDRMLDFLGSRFLQLLSVPSRNVVGRIATAPFYRVANLLLGGDFFKEILEFFALIRTLQPNFRIRSRSVQALLRAPSTKTITVSTADADVWQRSAELQAALQASGMRADDLVLNRIVDELAQHAPEPSVGVATDPHLQAVAQAAHDDLTIVRQRQHVVIESARQTGANIYLTPLLVQDDDRLAHLLQLADATRRHTV
jgi:anion-transporting  ArsA/GET3 family ATPase